jgi:hypothetical protein
MCHVKIYRVTDLLSTLSRVYNFYINSNLSYDRFINFWCEFVYDIWRVDMPYDLKFIFDIPYDRNEYMNTSCLDAPIPPHFSILRCIHRKDTHVKQSRHPNTAARAYYSCPYKSVSNNTLHIWILCNLTLTRFFSCPSRISVDSFSGLMDPRCWIQKFFFSHMIGMNLLRCGLSSIGFLLHQIHRQWQIKRGTK